MTGEPLTDVLRQIADRARPVDGLAEAALRRAARRRRVRVLAGAAALGTAAAVAVPLILLGGGVGEVRPAPPLAAPTTTAVSPEERGLVNVCLRGGPPTGGMGEPQRLPKKGGPADFRLLVGARAGAERVAVVGNAQGFVLCAVQSEVNTEPPYFRPWPDDLSQGLWAFPGWIRIDAVSFLTRVGENGRGSSLYGLHHLVAGRVKDGAARVEVLWNRGRRADATLHDGYFLARLDSRMVPDPSAAGTWKSPDDRVLSVTAFGADGSVLETWKAPGKGVDEFDSARCPYEDRSPLCG